MQLFQVVTVLVGVLLSLLSFVYDGRETEAIQLLNPFTLAGIAVFLPSLWLPFAATLAAVLAGITWLLDPFTQLREMLKDR